MNALLPGEGLAAAAWLAVVLVLIFGAARMARWLPALRRAGQAGGELALRGSLALDGRRRLHLVETGGVRALVLTGGASEAMLVLPPQREA